MASAEGQFPKVGFDPLYFSEVNKFNNSPVCLGFGSGIAATNNSAWNVLGSIVVPLGSIYVNNGILEVDYAVNTGMYVATRISGTAIAANARSIMGSPIAGGQAFGGIVKLSIGIAGLTIGTSIQTQDKNQDPTVQIRQGGVNGVTGNPGSGFVILMEGWGDAGLGRYNGYYAFFFPVPQ